MIGLIVLGIIYILISVMAFIYVNNRHNQAEEPDTFSISWVAQICYNYKVIYIGSFNTEYEACLAYNEKALELFGEFAKLNKI